MDVGVEPGSRVELLANLAFNWGNFTLDFGYNLFAKEAENVMSHMRELETKHRYSNWEPYSYNKCCFLGHNIIIF